MARYEDVAVVGLAGVFPEAGDLAELHRNLAEGRDSVRPLPPERIEHTSIDPALEYPTVGCLDRIDLFDHKFFNISLREAEYMDPHQRVTLELVCAAIENAGYSPASLRGTRTGVFLSAPRPEYYELFRDVDPLELLGNAPSALAGRISYVLDLHGPSIVVDAGCCASLVAVDAACRDLFDGEARCAIAGGVALTVLFEPIATTAAFTEIMSPGGKCKAFDASADGTAAGEGGAIVVLKLLRHALEDGDHVHAVIKGAAVNQNGYRSNGLSAPSPAAQAEVIAKAWERAGVEPASIGYVEAHGSGTRLGDVIEVQGLAEAFRDAGLERPCPIGSVKTNVGHLDHAAGIAGMVKAILSLEHKTLYPSLHYSSPNPLIEFEGAVAVQSEVQPWETPGDTPRRAGVSSFSLAGTNVHLVLEEAPETPSSSGGEAPELVTVSAKSGAALRDYCRSLAHFAESSDHDLAAIAAVMNRGRDDHQVRAAAVVASRDELVSWLEATAFGAEGLTPVPREARPLALLFSGDEEVPGQAFEQALDHLSPVASPVEMPDGATPGLRLFGRHQALHSLVRSLGLTEKSVLGSGVGNLTVRTILAGAGLEEATRAAATMQLSARVDVERLAKALDALGPDVVFLEMGGDGVLGRSVRAVRPDARVTPLLRGGASSLHALADLYAAGVAVDWDRFYDGRHISRIEAPTYPFQRERCWCRAPGDYRRHGVEHAPDEVRALIETPEVAPSGSFATDTERVLAGIWNEALKVDPADATADYFDLGGTSITGMVVLDGVARDFGVQIAFQDLYEHSRLDRLAASIDALAPTQSATGEPPIERIPRDGYLPVSYGQEQIWFLDQLEPGTPLYNIPFDLHLEGELDGGALQRALEGLALRHEVLRMGFVAVEGEPRAFVTPEPDVELPFVDLTSLPPGEARTEALRLFDDEATTPFDLSRPPLFRGKLVALGPGDHVLLMTFHHIVYDGWTPQIIQSELSALYGAAKEGREPALPALPIQYPDFAAWQRRWMSGDLLARGLEFWREHLAGAPPLDLPTDRPRPAVQSYSGGMVSLVIDEEVGDRLRQLSRRESVTMFTTMMAAFDVLMAKYSGGDDIVIGTPTSGRKKLETRGLIGYFNNMLPLRVRLDGDPSFTELMQRVKNVTARALDHDDVPFEKMVDELKPGRDLGRNPLFQVAYSHQNAPQEGYELKDVSVSTFGEGDIRGIAPGTAKFDLTLGIGDAGEGELEGYLEYATDLFDHSTAEAMVAHLQTLLASIVADPSLPLSRLALLDPAEQRDVVERHNEPLPERGADAGVNVAARRGDRSFLHERVAAHARSRPDAVALISGERELCYAELDGRAAAVAARLTARGVRRGDVVAVGLARSFDQVVAALGVLKAGAAYLPLDPAYPDARLAFMMSDARPAAMVADEGFAARAGATGVPLVTVADSAEPGERPAPAVGPDHLAYVIYTSGSTGQPKGVGITHSNLAHLVEWHAAAYPVDPGARASTMAPLSFDASVWELWWPLAAGAALVLVPDEVRADPDALVGTLARHEVAHAFVPTVLAPPVIARPAPATLKTLFVGGDRLTARPPVGFGPRVVNLYGPSEATVICTHAEVVPGTDMPGIGTPVTGARVYLLDENLDPVPEGLPGDIYVGGRGVGRGYVTRPGLTAERFVPDPFSSEPGARMYRSGDRGRYVADGTITYLGRTDHQVKVRGYRVEPGEVEAALLAHPGVDEAVVVLHGGRLVAYLVGSAPPDAHGGRAFLRDVLPGHMIPGAFVALDALPVTAGGKLDRAALPDPQLMREDVADAYAPPETRTEKILAEVWADVLRVERVGRGDNFFDLGGDSILSIQIVARAAAQGLKLLPKQLFEAQTIAELAALIEAPAAPARAPRGKPVTGPVPMTPIQRWFFEQDLSGAHHFNQAMILEVRGPADEDALRSALRALTDQHDVLRTRWQRDGLGWRGVIAPAEEADLLRSVDLSRHDPATTMLEIERAATSLQASLDLADGPLLRAGLFRFGDLQPPQVLLAIHHLVVDAISWGSLVHDLGAAYAQVLRGRPVELPQKTASFQEWARHLEARAGEIDPAEKAMWVERVSGLEPALLRRDGSGQNDVASAEEISLELDEARSRAVTETLVREHGLQPNETLLAALGLALRDVAEGRDLVVDVEGHGREPGESGLELSRTVGWFTTMFPVVLDVSAGAAAAVRAARDQMHESGGSGIGYGLLRYLGAPADAQPLRDAPQAEISFNYLGRFEGSLGGGGDLVPAEGPLGQLRAPAGARRHLIEAEAWVSEEKVCLDLVYSRALHDRATISAVRDAFVAAVDEVVAAAAAAAASAEGSEAAALLASRPGVVDAYPLTPMQQGLLFHSRLEPGGGLYHEQLVMAIEGDLDPARLDGAWQRVAARHPILGASVVAEDVAEPLLLVPAEPRVEVSHHDWRGTEEDLDAFLAADRARGLDLGEQLMRVALITVAGDLHRLVWSHHHLLLDGWSVQLVLDELLELYEKGEGAQLEPAGDYKAFATWLRGSDPALDYWREALRGFDAPTDLHLVPPAPPGAGHGMVARSLDADATAAVADFARRRRVTMSTLVEAAWAVTLGVYSGSDDVLFGALASGRSAPVDRVERTVGLFINTIPVRIRIPAAAPVGGWLRDLQSQALERRDHEHAPLVDVQQVAGVAAPAPLFETLIAYENYPVGDVWDEDDAGLRISGAAASENTNYPVSLVIAPGDGLTFRLSFDRSRVEEREAAALVERFAVVLRGLTEDAARPVGALTALTDDDRSTLARFNGTRVDHGNDLLVHEMFEERAAATPAAEAVSCGDDSVTYAELNERAAALADHLRDLGVGPDVLVAICCERSVAMVAAMLAVLKAGGAYVPVDPRYPPDRVAYMLEDTAAPVLLAERHLAERLPAGAAKVVLLDATGNGTSSGSRAVPAREPSARNLAYVLYTSGSTGRPKGIGIEHRSVTAFLDWAMETWAGDLKVVMACTSMSFDVHVFEIFATLCSGGTVLLVEDALAFASLDRRKEMTLLNAVPSAVEELVAAEPLPPQIKTVNLPGEPLSRKLVDRIFDASSAERIVNLYGPTEDTTYSTAAFLRRGEERPPSIGRPIANTWIYLLDRNLRQVPPGVPGEVYIGGAGLARGYFGRPGMTAERFLPDVGAPEPGARMYKTGDLARHRPDGWLDFMGRLDHQVKVRGFRVELGEIEHGLLAHPEVRHAAVTAPEATSGRRIVAYVVPEDGATPDAAALRAHLAARLPDYMLPSAFVLLDELPLNPNGKIDRAALPEPGASRPPAGVGAGKPATPTERLLASIWRELLDVPEVRRDDSFFDLGGQSLLATRLVSRIRETWGVDARLRVAFDAPVLHDLAAAVADLAGGAPAADAIASAVAEVESLSEEDVKRMLAALEDEARE
ncbi:MAG: amino acid adenylation domain-containing protein [Actinomycetota bacterium]|nr:amino acid adenylation domain-containing protein [Actinomycetota bacterium]